jgi:hypothetical protein
MIRSANRWNIIKKSNKISKKKTFRHRCKQCQHSRSSLTAYPWRLTSIGLVSPPRILHITKLSNLRQMMTSCLESASCENDTTPRMRTFATMCFNQMVRADHTLKRQQSRSRAFRTSGTCHKRSHLAEFCRFPNA